MSGLEIVHTPTGRRGVFAKIDSTHFGVEDHGIATFFLNLKWNSGGVGVGGYGIDTPLFENPATGELRTSRGDDFTEFRGRFGTDYGLQMMLKMLTVVGVEAWEKLPGQTVLVLFGTESAGWGSLAKGIANPFDPDKYLVLEDFREEHYVPLAVPLLAEREQGDEEVLKLMAWLETLEVCERGEEAPS